MNRGELKTALKRYGFNDFDPLDVWINAARNELVADLPITVNEEETTFVTAAGDGVISDNLPADFLKPVRLLNDTDTGDSFDLEYMDYRQFGRDIPDRTETGPPRIFTVRNLNQIQVWPVPEESTTWTLSYIKTVNQLDSDGESPTEIPAQFHYAIVLRAAAMGLMAENEEERAQTALNEYLTAKQVIINVYSSRQAGHFTSVGDVMGYGEN